MKKVQRIKFSINYIPATDPEDIRYELSFNDMTNEWAIKVFESLDELLAELNRDISFYLDSSDDI